MIRDRAHLACRSINMPVGIIVLLCCLAVSLARHTVAQGGEMASFHPSTAGLFLEQETKFTTADGLTGDFFGASVAVSGDTALIGARFHNVGQQNDQGAAYVFVREGDMWTLQAKLTAENGFATDRFGGSVGISGDTAVVGAEGDGGLSSGAAYVFVRNGTTWTEQAKLTASDSFDFKLFGGSVAIDGDTIAVGAIGDDEKGGLAGAIYVFVRNGTVWTQQAKLTADDGGADDLLGGSVSISGDTVAVGAEADMIGENEDQGSAYVFVRNGTTWTQQAKLVANDGSEDDAFGDSVSVSGNTVVVGSSFDIVGGNIEQGSAYVFVRNGTAWTQQAKLTASDGTIENYFGTSVAISGDRVVIGAPFGASTGDQRTGTAYLFMRQGTNWSEQEKLTPSDGAANDSFGEAVAISENNVVIGAFSDDIGANSNQGSAYGFRLDEIPPNALPTVSITKPSNGKVFPPGKRKVKIKANAADSDGTIEKVEFFQGDTKIGEDTVSPYVFKWKRVSPGTYTITARATDDKGAVTVSGSVTVTVSQ
ncbi:MAG: Ig-like domain-containing protein [Blastocatellia bacterium]|nr:Ig-like domain-containing protein [Blastocatellia bacterium]